MHILAILRHALTVLLLSVTVPTACSVREKPPASDLPADTSQAVQSVELVPNEFIISFTEAFTQELLQAGKRAAPDEAIQEKLRTQLITDRFGERLSRLGVNYEMDGATVVCFFVNTKEPVAVERIAQALAGPEIDAVRNNRIVKMEFPLATPVAACPNNRELQWGVEKVSNSSKPNGNNYKTAWVLDTGIDKTHPDLNVHNLSISFIPSETDVTDYRGHGTHVAGIIGAKAGGGGVIGVAPNAPIRALKVFPKVGGLDTKIFIKALNYVLSNSVSGDVVNLSIDSAAEYPDETKLIKMLADKGVFISIAAGNIPKSVDGVLFPAAINYKNVFTVSNMDDKEKFSSTSSWGANSIDFAAPGVSICSTWMNGGLAIDTGTSMSAPHVSGLLLLLQKKPNAQGLVKGDPDGNADPIAHE